jgi:hypothetical protein
MNEYWIQNNWYYDYSMLRILPRRCCAHGVGFVNELLTQLQSKLVSSKSQC